MPSPMLSICIPTYNFGKFIAQTLDSILSDLPEGVEIVILDGGSTDETDRVVEKRHHDFPQIKYHQQGFRGGIDRDIAKVVSLSSGTYCWLFSADDLMKPGAVRKMLGYLSSQCDIYLCEHTLCDYEMHPMKAYPIFDHITSPELFDFSDPIHRRRYFSQARTSEAFFSFLSGPVFRRDLWEKARDIPESFYGTCWALAGRLLRLVRQGVKIHYLAESLIFKRSGNDSFLELGVVNRLRITVEGFGHISETIFGRDSEETRHIRRVLRNERTLPHLLGIKLMVATSSQKEKMTVLNQIVLKHYSNVGIENTCKYVLFRIAPPSLLKLGRFLRQILRKKNNIPEAVEV